MPFSLSKWLIACWVFHFYDFFLPASWPWLALPFLPSLDCSSAFERCTSWLPMTFAQGLCKKLRGKSCLGATDTFFSLSLSSSHDTLFYAFLLLVCPLLAFLPALLLVVVVSWLFMVDCLLVCCFACLLLCLFVSFLFLLLLPTLSSFCHCSVVFPAFSCLHSFAWFCILLDFMLVWIFNCCSHDYYSNCW